MRRGKSMAKLIRQPNHERQSGFETLRIVAISMILIHHFLLHAIQPDTIEGIYPYLNAFVYCGVNLFFLISGWFGIRLTLRALIKIVGMVFLYTLINYMLVWIFCGEWDFRKVMKFLFFPISSCNYWFIKVYVLMMLTSPLINSGLRSLKSNQLRSFVILFSFFIMYSCAMGSNYTNPDGYSYVNALYLYCLAYYLRVDSSLFLRLPKGLYILGYVLLSILGGYLTVVSPVLGLMMKYNGLITVLSSALLLLCFSRLTFKSNLINRISSAALGCYLLQDGVFGSGYLYGFLHGVYVTHPLTQSVMVFIGFFLGTWIVSYVLTWLFNEILVWLSGRLEGLPLLTRPFEALFTR